MGMTAMIWLGVLVWILLAILVALFVAKMIRLRNRQCPDGVESVAPAQGESVDGDGPIPKSTE